LDIGKDTLKIAFLSLSKGRVELLRYKIKKKDPGELQDGGRALTEFIRSFITANSITEKNIIISLQDPDALVVKRINLPSVPEKEMAEAIKWEIKDEVPFNLNEAQIDWQAVGEYTDKEGAKREDLIVVCARKDLIARYIQIAKRIGLNVVDIKSPSVNFSYILEKNEASKKGVTSILDVGAAGSTFSIYKDGRLNFLRNLPFSSEQFTASISGAIISSDGRLELTREKSEQIREEFGIPEDPNQILNDGIKASQVISLIRPALERLTSEISKSITYYTASFESDAPKTLYITGGGSNLKGLDLYLKNGLRFDVNRLPLSETARINKNIEAGRLKKDINQLAGVVGAGLGINSRPSLLPQQYKTEKVEAFEKTSLRLIGITVGCIFLFSLFAVRTQVSDYENRLKNAKLHLQAIHKIGDLNNEIVQRVKLIEKIESDKIPPDWILKELSNLAPSVVVLEELTLDQEQNALILKGYVISQEEKVQDELTTFMKDLEASPFFSEATLRSSNKTKYEERNASSFELRCDLIR